MLRSRSSFSLPIAALLTLIVGLLVSAILFAAVRRLEHDKVDIDFQQRAEVRVSALTHGLEHAVQILTDINQLFVTFESVSREQFHSFTQPLLARYPHIQAFAYHRIASAAERSSYETALSRRLEDFSVVELADGKRVPAGIRDYYRVVEYVEPKRGNEAALGFDSGSNPLQDAAMRRAVDTGQPSATGLLRLMQDSGNERGFAVLMPVYRPGARLEDVTSRRNALIGDTTAVFRGNDLIARALDADGLLLVPGIDINVYASAAPDEDALVFREGGAPPLRRVDSWIPRWLFYDQPDSVSYTFDIAGQPWHIVVSTPPTSFAVGKSDALWVLLVGILYSVIAAAYLQTLIARSRRTQLLVDERTAQLRAANEHLIADIAARRRAEQALQLRERAIEASTNAIIITSAQAPLYPIEYVNPAFEHITGYTAMEVTGRNSDMFWDEDCDQPGIEEIRAALAEQRAGHAVLRTYRKDKTMFWSDIYIAPVNDGAGVVSHFVMAQYDITETKRYESELEFQTSRDALTGLANRNLLRDRLSQEIAYAVRYGHPIWVMFVDLDRFKFVNDTLGHQAGDLLLKAVAERLQSSVRETDTVARLGSDEFVLVLPERIDEGLATSAVQRIMDAVAKPLKIEGHEFFISCSVGMAVYPADGNSPEDLIRHADIAMYRAKETGRNNFQFYTPAMNERALERLRIEGDLHNALERHEFVLHYQPRVDLESGEIVGMEALIRWQHPELGMVPPGRFIGIAEENGLIVPIGAWVIRTACVQNKAWQDAGLRNLRMSVNLSARQFAQRDLVQSIAAVLEETGLAPDCLEIELTESLVMADVDRAIGILRELKALGVKMSIDDFGTGYSSLSYLKRFPIDVLKIDQSFVHDITVDPDDAAIVASIISLAHNLRLHVIAEGVETEAQLAYLQRHGCDQIQGYFFSPPVSTDAFEQMLRDGKRLAFDSANTVRDSLATSISPP